MYSISIQSQQTLTVAMIIVSISETDDDGSTHHLATAVTHSTLQLDSDQGDLHQFTEQTIDGVVKALSTRGGKVWAYHE